MPVAGAVAVAAVLATSVVGGEVRVVGVQLVAELEASVQ
jgi:hypothetical protein